MATTIPDIETITFTDWFLRIIDTPGVPIDEIEISVIEGFKKTLTDAQFQHLTSLIHLISFIKHRNFSNPTLALRIYIDENTSPYLELPWLKQSGCFRLKIIKPMS